jgi:HEAT repeat protein
MRKRWLVVGILFVIACSVAAALAFPAAVYVSMGLVRREAFFAGKPTNYWVRALKREGFMGHQPPAGDIGKTLREGGPAAVPVLCELADNPDANIRYEAMLGLSLIGSEAEAATPVLTATIKKEMNSARFLVASEALAKANPVAAAETLSAVLRDKHAVGRAWALAVLLKLAPGGRDTLPALREILQDPDEDPRLRVEAIHVLWRLKQPAEPLVAALCAILDAGKDDAGVQALEILAEMETAAKAAVPTLLKLLDKPTLATTGRAWGRPHRQAVIRTLGKIGPEANAAVPALIAILKSNNDLRKEVVAALAQMGPPAKQAVADQLRTLTAEEALRWTTITLLASERPANATAFALAGLEMKTWTSQASPALKAIREALRQFNSIAAPAAAEPGIAPSSL